MQVWTASGDVREVAYRPGFCPMALWFTDCTHALQNAYCSRDSVQAWRYVTKQQ